MKSLGTRTAGLLRRNIGLVVIVLGIGLFRSAVADWNDVPTGSMRPSILEGDRILVDKLAYDLRLPFTHISLLRLGEPQRGDVVVFESAAADKRLVKRVVGIPGDEIALLSNRLWINGEPVAYEIVARLPDGLQLREQLGAVNHLVQVAGGPLSSFGPVRIPAGHYLMMGDNRDNSADSRVFGLVPRSEITGRAHRVVVSLDPDHNYQPRTDRFFMPLN